MSKTIRHLMSIKVRMLKDKKLLSGRSTMVSTRDGELSIQIKQPRKLQRDTIKTSDSTSIDSSTSDQDSQ
jgi:hypothetical protein